MVNMTNTSMALPIGDSVTLSFSADSVPGTKTSSFSMLHVFLHGQLQREREPCWITS